MEVETTMVATVDPSVAMQGGGMREEVHDGELSEVLSHHSSVQPEPVVVMVAEEKRSTMSTWGESAEPNPLNRAEGRVSLEQVLRVFEHEHTSDLLERHLSLVHRVLDDYESGFRYKQLPLLCELLRRLWSKVTEQDQRQFERPLEALLRLCGKPLVRDKANEELLGGMASLETLVVTLETFLHVHTHPAMQIAAAMTLRNIALGKDPLREKTAGLRVPRVLGAGEMRQDLRPLPMEVNQAVLLKAGVVEGLVKQINLLVERVKEARSLANDGLVLSTLRVDQDDEEREEMHEVEVSHTIGSHTLKAELVAGVNPAVRSHLHELMKLLRELSSSPQNAASIIRAKGMNSVLQLLDILVREPRDPLINVAVEVLWNCLEHSQNMLETGRPASSRRELIFRRRKANAMYALATETTLSIIKNLLEALIVHGNKARDKELRNEVLIIASFIARERRSHVFFRTTGLLDLLLTYATAAETRTSTQAPQSHYATMTSPDIELKRLLWALLSDLSKHDAKNLQTVVQESQLIETLVMYLNVDLRLTANNSSSPLHHHDVTTRPFPETGGGNMSGDSAVGRGSAAVRVSGMGSPYSNPNNLSRSVMDERKRQKAMLRTGSVVSLENNNLLANIPVVITRLPRTNLRVLQQQAMAVLLNLVPRAPEKFKSYAGHVITLRFLDACSREANDLVQGALMLLLSFVGLPGLQDELGKMDAVKIMLARFNDVHAPSALRGDAVCIVSRLCTNHFENQAAFRQADGIASLISELDEYIQWRDPAPRVATQRKGTHAIGLSGSASEKVSPLTVGVVDCLWNAVVGNERSESRFLSLGGMDALCSLLEVCPLLMRHQVTGLIADLCENDRMVPYLKAWRSDLTMRSAIQLILHMFEDEEVRLGFARNHGVISNLSEPLRRHETGPNTTNSYGLPFDDDTVNPGVVSPADLLLSPLMPSSMVGGGVSLASVTSSSPSMMTHRDVENDTHDVMPGTPQTPLARKGAPFSRLSSALRQSSTHKAEKQLTRAVGAQDLRAKITAILSAVGFDGNYPLAANERSTLLMAQRYVQFRAGESWSQVRRELRNESIKPIAADSYLLENKLEEIFNAAREAKAIQMTLEHECGEEAKQKEEDFFRTIRSQRDQEEKQLMIKKVSRKPKTWRRKSSSRSRDATPVDEQMAETAPPRFRSIEESTSATPRSPVSAEDLALDLKPVSGRA